MGVLSELLKDIGSNSFFDMVAIIEIDHEIEEEIPGAFPEFFAKDCAL